MSSKKKKRSPFSLENEHSYDDLIEFAISTLKVHFEYNARDLLFDIDITRYIAELIVQITKKGKIEKADEILGDFLKKIEIKEGNGDNIATFQGNPHWDPYIISLIGILAHATAYLARMGYKEIASRHLKRIKEIYHSIVNNKEISPVFVTPAAAWIGATEKILNGDETLLGFAEEIEGKMEGYEGNQKRLEVAYAFAFTGDWEKALSLLSRSIATRWYELGGFLSLLEENKDLKLFENFLNVTNSETFRENFSDCTQIRNKYAVANADEGNFEKAWQIVKPDVESIISAILDYPSWNIMSGGYTINAILKKIKEKEGKEGIAKLLGPAAEEALKRALEKKEEPLLWLSIISLWRKYDSEAMETEYNEFLNKVVEKIDSIELGNKIKFLACISTENPLWEKVYKIVEKEVIEHGYGSLSSYDIFLQTIRHIPEAVEKFVQARIDRIPETVEADYRSLHFQELSSAAAYAGDMYASHIARKKISKKWRYIPTAHIARAAFLKGNISAGIAALNELPWKTGQDGIYCSAIWPFIYAFGDRIPLIAPVF